MLNDLDPMPFGIYKNKPMQEVPASYLFWLWTVGGKEHEVETNPVANYIYRNLLALEKEYPNGVWR